ncbi:MAG: anhydro-N-acetylmuramic acid kinase [Pseudomonadota bacterium]
MRPLHAIGIMSGTSLDGIDAVLVRAVPKRSGYGVQILGHRFDPFPRGYSKTVRAAAADDSLRTAARIGAVWSERSSRTVLRLLRSVPFSAARVDCIAAHGQTLVHEPIPTQFLGERIGFTIQVGDLSRLAIRTAIPVVGNFRAADVAEGGHGAPLTPHGHALLFGTLAKCVAVQNLGGIGNVTLLRNGRVSLAFDTGPANAWIDAVVRQKTNGRLAYDRDGRLAERGKPDGILVAKLAADPYFRKKPPKSAGWEQFGPARLAPYRARFSRLSLADAVATATYATAFVTAEAYQAFVFPIGKPKLLILTGGGAKNSFFVRLLGKFLPELRIVTSDAFGIPPDQLEAVCFALLGIETLRGRPSSEPSATGARKAALCGEISFGGVGARIDRVRSVLLR